jgi:hypothetical protein
MRTAEGCPLRRCHKPRDPHLPTTPRGTRGSCDELPMRCLICFCFPFYHASRLFSISGAGPMRHLFHIALAIHLVSSLQLGEARAAGPYDGKWVSSATSNVGRCKPANVALSVQGKEVTGEARFEVDTPKINGSVSSDGAFGATIGWQPLTGSSARIGSKERSRMVTAYGKCSWNARSSGTWSIDISLMLRERYAPR